MGRSNQGDCKVVEGSAGGKPAGILHPFGCASRGVSPKLNLLLARAIAKYLLPRKRYFAIALEVQSGQLYLALKGVKINW